MLGKLTLHATVSTHGDHVTLKFHQLPAANFERAERLMVTAGAKAEKGDVQKAVSLYRQVVTLDPTHQDARYRLALLLLKSRNTRAGIDSLLEILKIHPSDQRALAILGKGWNSARGSDPSCVAGGRIR